MQTYNTDPINQTSVQRNGPLTLSYPFEADGDVTSIVISAPMISFNSAYKPLAHGTFAPLEVAAFVTAPSSLYYLDDDSITETDTPLKKFVRNYGTVPVSRSVSIGTTAYTYPAILEYSGSSIALTGGNGSAFTSSLAHNLSVGDLVQIFTSFTAAGTGYQIIDQEIRPVQATPTTTTFVVPTIVAGLTFQTGSITKIGKRVESKSMIAPAKWEYVYYPPNTDPSTITVEQPFEVLSANGSVVNEITNDTIPSAAQYAAMVASGSYLVYETEISKWRGGMLQKIVKKVRAL